MEIRVTPRQVDLFRAPKRTLGDIGADAAARLVAAGSDIALVIDAKGVIRDVACGSDELINEGYERWVGQRWVDTVTIESREKITELLNEASSKALPRWRQVNHASPRGNDLPIRYTAIQVAQNGRIVAVGRDLRALAALQQKLVDTQMSVEREYARLRHAETRYRLLFQISSEAVLIIDSATMKVVEANPATGKVLNRPVKKIVGRPFLEQFSEDTHKKLQQLLTAAGTPAKAGDLRIRLADTKLDVNVSATLFRQDTSTNYLIKLTPVEAAAAAILNPRSNVMDVIQKMPDGFVVTDEEGRVLTANQAFLDLAQAATDAQVKNEPLSRWLGRHAVDMVVLMKNLKERGEVRNFGTVMRGRFGSDEDVEVSAVAVTDSDTPCIGFAIRSIGRRPDAVVNGRRAVPRSVEQLTELVGRVALKDLVRESTDMIERLCIEAALELTGDNRASAAEMLGLSRQGLYSKLRRHGLGDLDGDPAS